ncbi:MAG: hypothetical protein ACJAV2_005197 [Myxococcota bacterium]
MGLGVRFSLRVSFGIDLGLDLDLDLDDRLWVRPNGHCLNDRWCGLVKLNNIGGRCCIVGEKPSHAQGSNKTDADAAN